MLIEIRIFSTIYILIQVGINSGKSYVQTYEVSHPRALH